MPLAARVTAACGYRIRVHEVGVHIVAASRRTGRGELARRVAAAVLVCLAVAACGTAVHTGAPVPSALVGSGAASPSATAAKEICTKRFRHTTVAMMTTLRQAFARGTLYPGEIFGSSSYPPDSPRRNVSSLLGQATTTSTSSC